METIVNLTKFVKLTKHNAIQSYLGDYFYRDLKGLVGNFRTCLGIQRSTSDPRGGVYRGLFLATLVMEVKIMRACALCGATPAPYRPGGNDEQYNRSRWCQQCFDRTESSTLSRRSLNGRRTPHLMRWSSQAATPR